MKNFPAWFFDKTDWQEKTLGEVAEKIIGGGTPDTANRNFYAGNVTWISSSDLTENDVHKISKTRFITEDAIKNSATKKIPPKSILIVTRVGVGKVALSDEILCTSQDFTNLILKENFLPEFFVYQIAIKMKIAAQQTQGTAIKGITTDEVKKIKIKIPSLEEQKKIAEYFTSLDKAINAQDLKLKSWRDAKKAMLQKIFSQEFYFTTDNGKKYPAWQEKTLGELLQKSTNKSSEKILEAYSVNNKLGLVRQDEFFEDSRYARLDKSANKIVCPNEFVYNPARINVGSIAYNDLKKSVRVSPLYIIFKTTEQIEDKFLWQYFQTKKFFDEMKIKLEGSVRFCLNFENLCSMKIKIPCLEEQKKIAEYFSSLDKIIDAENKMLESLRLMKRGLLQKLFI